VLDSRYRAKRLQRSLACIEEASVAHDAADPLRRPDNLGITSGGLQDAEDPGVEDRNDLRQPRRDRDFADAQYELAQDIVDASSASFWLSGDRGGADARTFPYGGALDVFSVEQLRKDVTQHVWTSGWQQSQGTPVFFGIRIDRYQIERVCIVEYVSLVAIFNFDLPAKPIWKGFGSIPKHRIDFLWEKGRVRTFDKPQHSPFLFALERYEGRRRSPLSGATNGQTWLKLAANVLGLFTMWKRKTQVNIAASSSLAAFERFG
jgi:hypothetical protein